MSDYGQLTVQKREGAGKGVARKLRAAGKIPGVMYGRGKDNVMLTVDPAELRKSMDPQRKLNTFFHVEVEGGDKESCVISDYQMDPIRDEFLHVDFLRVDPEAEVFVKIPVVYRGRSAGVVAGGKLKTLRRFVRIAAKPADIPVELHVDLTPLQIGQTLRLKDAPLANARLLENPELPTAIVEAPKKKAVNEKKAKK